MGDIPERVEEIAAKLFGRVNAPEKEVYAVAREIASEEGNRSMRHRIAIHLALTGMPEATEIVRNWMEQSGNPPIPYPNSPELQEWVSDNGFTNVRGSLGFVLTAALEQGDSENE